MTDPVDLEALYQVRFDGDAPSRKLRIWHEIVAFLEPWIPPDGAIIDIACDEGYFIRNVTGRERWATDLRDVGDLADHGVRFVRVDGLELTSAVPVGYFDVAFMSNYLEHLPSSDAVLVQLRQAHRILRPGGRLIVIQPNIRFVGSAYWDFLDHRVALTDRSLAEGVEAAGFEIETLIPRFLPYTTKGRLPQHPALVRAYLRFPPAWRLLGKQTLLVARSTGAAE
ncbi:MAG: class I SAM-dependent methyltransferase [Chloroflexi bacterium]|nr:class I SAM-dependent methyltransferase [Chloroflexota bacterium]